MIYLAIDAFGLEEAQPYTTLADVALGLIIGALITGVIYTSRHMSKIRAAKMRLWKRIGRGGRAHEQEIEERLADDCTSCIYGVAVVHRL